MTSKTTNSMFIRRLIVLIIGSMIMGTGIALSISTGHGSDALSWLWQGVQSHTSLTLNQANMIIAGIMLIPPLIFDRSQIGIGTILQPLIVGGVVEFLLEQDLSNPDNYFILFLGILLLGFGAGVYTSTNLGKVPYDACIFLFSERTNKSIGFYRSLGDILMFFIAWTLNKNLVIGPLLSAVFVGIILNLSYKWATKIWKIRENKNE